MSEIEKVTMEEAIEFKNLIWKIMFRGKGSRWQSEEGVAAFLGLPLPVYQAMKTIYKWFEYGTLSKEREDK